MKRDIILDREEQREKLENLKNRLREKFTTLAEPMNDVEYTRENYDKLFPGDKINTPLGEVKMRGDQFGKLKRKGRQNLLGAMHQTLSDPIAVINEDREGEMAKIFSKSFLENKKPIMSVVIDNKGKNTAVSTHERELNNIINKIKNPADLIFEKQTCEVVGPAGDDTYSLNLAISGDTQSSTNIPQPSKIVKGKKE